MRCVDVRSDELGECPTWDERSGRLLRIDVTGRKLRSCGFEGEDPEEVGLSEYPGSFALRGNGGLLMAYRRRLALRDLAGAEISIAMPSEWDGGRERFNDGSCDASGRYWVGTMDRHLRDAVGALYRVDQDLTVYRISSGFGLSNGITWSPDRKTMYHCDSRPPVIYAYDFDLDAGAATNRRIFIEFAPHMGLPDGCAMDVEGFLWVAAPHTGQIMRFDPSGRLERTVKTIAAQPTSVTFGGADLRTLFVTSMRPHGTDINESDGAVFAFQAPAAGMQSHRFEA